MNHNQISRIAAERVEKWLERYNTEPEKAMKPKQFVQELDKELGLGELAVNRKLARFNYQIRDGELIRV